MESSGADRGRAVAWTGFCRLNENRRAIRHFAPEPIEDEDVQAVLGQAVLAPSSSNLQPYALHWVRESRLKAKVAAACMNQRAAVTAPTLIVVAASPRLAARTVAARKRELEHAEMTDASRRYHVSALRKSSWTLRLGMTGLFSPLQTLLTALWPEFGLLPFGLGAQRHWAARSAVYAAQTLLLAAVARGLHACPMEGFHPRSIAKLLRLPRGTVVPVVIALGRRASDARLEPRWRLPIGELVVVH